MTDSNSLNMPQTPPVSSGYAPNYGQPVAQSSSPVYSNQATPQKSNKKTILIFVVLILLCCCVTSSIGAGAYVWSNRNKDNDSIKTRTSTKVDDDSGKKEEEKEITPTTAAKIPSNYIKYVDYTHDYEISYPNDWTKTSGSYVMFASPFGVNDTFSESLNIIVEENSLISEYTPEEYAEAALVNIKATFSNLKVITEKNTTIDSRPAYQLVYTATVAGEKKEITQYIVLDEDKAFIISIGNLSPMGDDYTEEFENMVASFKIN